MDISWRILSRSFFILIQVLFCLIQVLFVLSRSYFFGIFSIFMRIFRIFSDFFGLFSFFPYAVIQIMRVPMRSIYDNTIGKLWIKNNWFFFRIFYFQDFFFKMRIGHFWMSIFDFKKKVYKNLFVCNILFVIYIIKCLKRWIELILWNTRYNPRTEHKYLIIYKVYCFHHDPSYCYAMWRYDCDGWHCEGG